MIKRIAVIWVVGFAITWPALFADLNRDGPADECRRHMGAAMLFAALPPLWIGAPFVTGFYERGFKFSCP